MNEKYTFEDCLDYINNKLGYKLLPVQEKMLRYCYENKNAYVYLARYTNKTYWIYVYNLLQEIKEKMQNEQN